MSHVVGLQHGLGGKVMSKGVIRPGGGGSSHLLWLLFCTSVTGKREKEGGQWHQQAVQDWWYVEATVTLSLSGCH